MYVNYFSDVLFLNSAENNTFVTFYCIQKIYEGKVLIETRNSRTRTRYSTLNDNIETHVDHVDHVDTYKTTYSVKDSA